MLHALTSDRKTNTSSKTAKPMQDESSMLLGKERSRQPSAFQPGKDLAVLQKTYGNQSVLRMQQGVLQRKCACGNSAGAARTCTKCHQKKETHLSVQRKATQSESTNGVPSIVHEVLGSSGQSLNAETNNFMESRFGRSFDDVQIHDGVKANESARALNALAYTVGNHIVFGAGQYAPQTTSGRKLLAHELTHVVQQSQAPTSAVQPLSIGSPQDAGEVEAEQVANAVVTGQPIKVAKPSLTLLQRYSHADCSDPDLRTHVWPSDWVARQMVSKAIRVLSATPIDPRVSTLFANYFQNSSPNVSRILQVFRSVEGAFTRNNYTYECEESCSGTEQAYVRGLIPYGSVHLCMSVVRAWTSACIARAIIHEFTHRYVGTFGIGDKLYCNTGCGCSPCDSSLSANDALDNADSYACFAFNLYPLSI